MIDIRSEIGRLEQVVVHSPGREIQDMTPTMAAELLYNDIIPLSVVSEEHARLKGILQRVSTVYEYTELLCDVLEMDEVRESLSAEICRRFGIPERRAEMDALTAGALCSALVTGIEQNRDSLEKFLSQRIYDVPPVPNLYFTRDSAMVFGSSYITGAMANDVRRTESMLSSCIFAHHPLLANNGCLFGGHSQDQPDISLEGGDFLVLSENLLMIGVSERTTAAAVDKLVQRISADRKITVFAVILPKKRATIHLDMIFTQLDRNAAMVYKPFITGQHRLDAVRIDAAPGSLPRISQVDDLLTGLRAAGLDLEPVFCGGGDPVQQEREQWLSGNNFFTIAPGKIIGYACNNYTLDALSRAGFAVKEDRDFLVKGESIDRYGRLVIGINGVELARGGGGARCMTMPVKRSSI